MGIGSFVRERPWLNRLWKGRSVAFLIWCIVVALMDNVLKPLLLGGGLPIPIIVVFLGTMGGLVALGIIGPFVGPILLSVGSSCSLPGWMKAWSRC